jgi:GGDEF domain-containing protein
MPAATLSISIGISDFFVAERFQYLSTDVSDEDAAQSLFSEADKALYLAKASGRNRAQSG